MIQITKYESDIMQIHHDFIKYHIPPYKIDMGTFGLISPSCSTPCCAIGWLSRVPVEEIQTIFKKHVSLGENFSWIEFAFEIYPSLSPPSWNYLFSSMWESQSINVTSIDKKQALLSRMQNAINFEIPEQELRRSNAFVIDPSSVDPNQF